MRLLSVVGIKTSKGRRTTIVQSNSFYQDKVVGGLFKRGQKTSLIILCTTLALYLQMKEYPPLLACQLFLVEAFNPVTQIISTPFQWLSNIQRYFQSKEEILAELQSLKLQNDSLLRHHQNTQRTTIENKKLREALNVQSSVVDDIITVRISHHTYDGYTKIFYSHVSDFESISKHNPVLTTTGYLVGRVTIVGNGNVFSQEKSKLVQIMPINDPGSRIPVKIEGTNEQAILKGKGQQGLELIHIENTAQLKVGQKLVTSGIGGIFPAEIPVAQISHVGTTILATPLGGIKDQDFTLILANNNSSSDL